MESARTDRWVSGVTGLHAVRQGAKEDQKDIVGIFQQLYSRPGGVVPLGASENSQRFSPNLVTPKAI